VLRIVTEVEEERNGEERRGRGKERKIKTKQTPCLLVRKRTRPTVPPPLVEGKERKGKERRGEERRGEERRGEERRGKESKTVD
jgi:hypothetical protein